MITETCRACYCGKHQPQVLQCSMNSVRWLAVDYATFHYQCNFLQRRDYRAGVAVDSDHVGQQAGSQRPQFGAFAQDARRHHGRCARAR